MDPVGLSNHHDDSYLNESPSINILIDSEGNSYLGRFDLVYTLLNDLFHFNHLRFFVVLHDILPY